MRVLEHRLHRVVAGIIACALVASAGATPRKVNAQNRDQRPTFRAGIDISRVTVRVLDKNRRPVHGLTEKDFVVLIDGEPRPIVAVDAEDTAGPVEVSAPWMREVAPDVAANSLTRPRLIVILIDDGLIQPGDQWVLNMVKSIARTAIDQLGPNDLASIVFTRDNREPRDFTADRARLLETVERTSFGFDRRNVPELMYAQRASLRTMRNAVEYLRTVPDLRGMVVYVTVGIPDPFGTVAPKMSGLGTTDLDENEMALELMAASNATMGAAHAAGVPVYGISPLGLVAPTPNNLKLTASAVAAPEARNMALMLKWLSEATGGRAVFHDNAPARFVPEVFAENSLHYTLAYESAGPMADGRYRRLEVRVTRPGAVVEPSGERMFLSPKPVNAPPPPETTRALSGVVPLADEPLRLAAASVAEPAAPAREARGVVTLALGIDVPAEYADVGDHVAIELRVFDAEGRREIDKREQAMRLTQGPAGQARHFDVLSRLTLDPGRYNIRMSAHSEARERSGSIHTDVTIPDYAKAKLSVSDVVLAAPFLRSATPLTATAGVLPVVPTTARTFATSDQVTAFMRVYRPGAGGPVRVAASVVDANNASVFSASTTLGAEAAAPSALPAADYRLNLPTSSLSTGEYLLTLRASADGAPDLVRHVRFAIR